MTNQVAPDVDHHLFHVEPAATVLLTPVAPDLSDLHGASWHVWPHWKGVVRRDGNRYVAVVPFMYTHAIIVGEVGETRFYENRWCYDSAERAIAAATVWAPRPGTEPDGWHRHPFTGRRRPDGDATREYLNP